MRNALNENPMVQMIVLGIAAVVLAFVMFTSVLKKEEPKGSSATDTSATAVAGDPAATADPAAAAPPATADAGTVAPPSAADTGTVAPPATGGSDGLLPSKGLPKDLLIAYAKGDAIALVVVDPKVKGSERLVEAAKSSGRGDVEVFEVDVDDIAKYSRITSGVSVSRAPALVMITPRKLSDGVPMATVTYGFRGDKSVQTAIDDAFYDGGNVPAYPSRG